MGFKFKVGENKFTALDEKKWYPVRLLSVEEDTVEWDNKPVAKFKFSFVILDPEEFEGREIGGMVNQPTGGELNERHTLFAWLTALRGGVPPIIGDEIDFPDQFLNKIVMAQVKSVKKNYQGREMVFQNVNKLAVCPNATDYALRASDKTGAGGPQTQTAAPATTRAAVAQPTANPSAPVNTQPITPAAPITGGSTTFKVDGEVIDVPF